MVLQYVLLIYIFSKITLKKLIFIGGKQMKKKIFSIILTLIMLGGLIGVVPAGADDIRNDFPALATNGVWRNGYIGNYEDLNEYDYHPIYTTATGKLTIDMQSFGDLYFEILDSEYNIIDDYGLYGSGGDPKNGTFTNWLEKGTYYVRVSEDYWSDTQASYRVKASFASAGSNEIEPNDTYLQAQSVSNGSTITGTITKLKYDEYDYYKINVSKMTVYSFYLTSYDSSTDFTLYDNNLNKIDIGWDDTSYSNETLKVTSVLNKGIYYVRISRSYSDCKYILKFNPQSTSKKSSSSSKSKKSTSKKKSSVKKPAKVKGLKITKIGRRTARISWNKVKGAKGYQVKVATNKSFIYAVKKLTKKKRVALKNLYSNKYYIKVRAYKKKKGKKIFGKYSKILSLSI